MNNISQCKTKNNPRSSFKSIQIEEESLKNIRLIAKNDGYFITGLMQQLVQLELSILNSVGFNAYLSSYKVTSKITTYAVNRKLINSVSKMATSQGRPAYFLFNALLKNGLINYQKNNH